MAVTGVDAERCCVRTDTGEEIGNLEAYARLVTLANLSVRYLAWPGRLNVIVGDPP